MPSSVLIREGPSTPAARPSVTVSRPDSIFAALTPAEAADFLPEPLATEVRGLVQRYLPFDPLAHSVEAFHQALHDKLE